MNFCLYNVIGTDVSEAALHSTLQDYNFDTLMNVSVKQTTVISVMYDQDVYWDHEAYELVCYINKKKTQRWSAWLISVMV